MPDPVITEEIGELNYPAEVGDFSGSERKEALTELMSIWKKDASFKLAVRKFFAFVFPIFLLAQNLVAYLFIAHIIDVYAQSGYIADIQPFLAVLTVGTLGETVLIIKIMVNWIFTDIKYNHHPILKLH